MILHAVLAGFVLAFFAPLLHRGTRNSSGLVMALLPAGIFLFFLQFVPLIASGETYRESTPWIESFGVHLSFYIDGLSLVFALLISGIGALIILYSGSYLKGHEHQGRFFGFMLAFMGSMLGLVLADNLISIFVFWELTSVTSFLLIGFDHRRAAARRAAIQALVVTAGGGLAMLAGFILMASAAGSMEMSEILQGGSLGEHQLYVPIVILVLAGAFTKSAQYPFHFWLPNAMEAPTPVSAYLHSATMVKAGIYLMARVNPILGGTDLWATVLPLVGATTFIYGMVLGLRQTDLKLMLAYTTVASLGLLTMLIGLGSEYAIEAAVLYLIAHSFFKGGLFLVAGCVDHETGTRETVRLGGLFRSMPITTVAAVLSGLSMMGIPFFFGFVAKEAIYEAVTNVQPRTLITAVAFIGNAMMFALAGLVAIRPFFGKQPELPKKPHEAPFYLWLGPLVLGAMGLAFGVLPAISGPLFVEPMASAIAGHSVHAELHLLPEFGLPLLLSGLTIITGLIIYFLADHLRSLFVAIGQRSWGPDYGSDQFLALLGSLSRTIVGTIQTGKLRVYLLLTLLMLAVALGAPIYAYQLIPDTIELPQAPFYVYGVLLLTVTGGFALVFSRSRLQSILSMGIVGFSVAAIFLMFGAPDLAFTQFMVETLSVVIIALVLLRLPIDKHDKARPWSAIPAAAVSIAVGGFFTILLMAVVANPLDLSLSTYFAENSYTAAHGRNIVNVILVDFRALDTLGEITVVMVAGLAALGLIKMRKGKLIAPSSPLKQKDAEGASK